MSAWAGSSREESFLLIQFRELYSEVVRWKQLVAREGEALPVLAAAGGPSQPGALVMSGPGAAPGALMVVSSPAVGTVVPAVAPATVWQALLGLLSRQEAEVRRTGGEYASAIYRRAQYVMAALADETFLYLDWPGREAWRTNLLEFKLFQSYCAGEEVFRRIDALLRTRDPADTDLAKIYLMALTLGFRGALRGADGTARIDWYRRELYTFLTNQAPGTPREPHSLFPEAYQNHLETAGVSRRLSPARRWLLTGLFLFLAWILVSHKIWLDATDDLRPLIQQVLSEE